MAKILGLDIGTNSVGWALIDDTNQTIINSGVRIFSEGVQEINTEKEASKNALRRMARQVRRLIERKMRRSNTLLNALIDLHLLPENDKQRKSCWYRNPYDLRKKALSSQLTLHEFGRALYHLNKRRGFKSNRKSDSTSPDTDQDTGVVINGITTLKNEIQASGARTMGEYFASLNPHEKRIRNRYASRDLYKEEFELLWTEQKKYHANILTDNAKERIHKIIFNQRPLRSQRSAIGFCTFEQSADGKMGKRRAAMSSLLAQECRMLQTVNNLRILGGKRQTEEQQILTEDEREKLIRYLDANKVLEFVSYEDVLKNNKKRGTLRKTTWYDILGLSPEIEYKCNFDKVLGNKTKVEFIEKLGAEFIASQDEARLEEYHHVLRYADDNVWLMSYVQSKWDITPEQAEQFVKIRLEDGYSSLSTKALKKIVPFLREGYRYDQACEQAGYHHSYTQQAALQNSIGRISSVLPSLRNPIVMVALTQVRHVVNELIEYYGKPDCIRIELARQLKMPRDKRIAMENDNKKREKLYSGYRNELLKEFPQWTKITKQDIERYTLWKEQKEMCIYTGEQISVQRLFGHDIDIDHILPYSRTLDDSYMNKVVCVRNANATKGNSITYEAFGGNAEKYANILERTKGLPHPKAARFKIKDLRSRLGELPEYEGKIAPNEEIGGFIHRQLTDTAYISRETKKLMETILPRKDIQVSNGQATALIRHLWGLNSILHNTQESGTTPALKNREDHRHHAVDAMVIALTTPGMLRQLSTLHAQNKLFYASSKRTEDDTLLPWKGFRDHAQQSVAAILVSHKFSGKVRGKMHEETFYGKIFKPSAGASHQEQYVVRKSLSALTATQVLAIVDDKVRAIVLQRLQEWGVDTSKGKFTIPRKAFEAPLYMTASAGKVAPCIKSVRVGVPSNTMKLLKSRVQHHGETLPFAVYVEPGNNHHYSIFRSRKGKKDVQTGEIMSLVDAYGWIKAGNTPIRKIYTKDPSAEFLYSLQKNEMFLWGVHPDTLEFEVGKKHKIVKKELYPLLQRQLYRIQKISQGKIDFRLHLLSGSDDVEVESDSESNTYQMTKGPSLVQGCKVVISPAGFLRLT